MRRFGWRWSRRVRATGKRDGGWASTTGRSGRCRTIRRRRGTARRSRSGVRGWMGSPDSRDSSRRARVHRWPHDHEGPGPGPAAIRRTRRSFRCITRRAMPGSTSGRRPSRSAGNMRGSPLMPDPAALRHLVRHGPSAADNGGLPRLPCQRLRLPRRGSAMSAVWQHRPGGGADPG